MADSVFTDQRPDFQPRPGLQGMATAYLAACLAGRVRVAESGCWEWGGTDNGRGYGFIDMKHWEWPERIVQVHRLVYRLCVGPTHDGACVLHRCDNPPCCRPDHLFLGTNLDNINDKVAKGRQASGGMVRTNHDHIRGEAVVTARLTAEQVIEMRQRAKDGEPLSDIAAGFQISDTHLSYILRGKAWAHLPGAIDGDLRVRRCPKCGVSLPTRFGKYDAHFRACAGADCALGKE